VLQAVQIVISGAAQGCIYGLIALGLVLIYKTTETVSFAHGELMMLGAFAGLGLMTLAGFPFWIAFSPRCWPWAYSASPSSASSSGRSSASRRSPW
jgi:branched-subunit amino acid ABC-type transport system permease component